MQIVKNKEKYKRQKTRGKKKGKKKITSLFNPLVLVSTNDKSSKLFWITLTSFIFVRLEHDHITSAKACHCIYNTSKSFLFIHCILQTCSDFPRSNLPVVVRVLTGFDFHNVASGHVSLLVASILSEQHQFRFALLILVSITSE